jgi:sporulation-control protein spo0M
LLEIDKRGRGLSGLFAEAYDLNERFTRLHVPLRGIDQQTLVRQLDGVIREALASTGFRR